MVPRDEGHCAVKQAVESLGREGLGAMVAMVTMRYITDRALLQERLTAILSDFFGTLALLLAGVGLYGLTTRWRSGSARSPFAWRSAPTRPESCPV
jgi:FtsH-binding integral membrane protein